jgi:Domain of unknown function (DUF4118)
MLGHLTRDRLAVLAGVAAPLALAAVLVPFRASFPNTDAALAMLLVVVAVAANGDRLAGTLAAVSTAVWFDFFLTRPSPARPITATSADSPRHSTEPPVQSSSPSVRSSQRPAPSSPAVTCAGERTGKPVTTCPAVSTAVSVTRYPDPTRPRAVHRPGEHLHDTITIEPHAPLDSSRPRPSRATGPNSFYGGRSSTSSATCQDSPEAVTGVSASVTFCVDSLAMLAEAPASTT